MGALFNNQNAQSVDFSWQQHREMQRLAKVPGRFDIAPFSHQSALNIRGIINDPLINTVTPQVSVAGAFAAGQTGGITSQYTFETYFKVLDPSFNLYWHFHAGTEEIEVGYNFTTLGSVEVYKHHVGPTTQGYYWPKWFQSGWHHLAITCSTSGGNDTYNVYLDGILTNTYTTTTLTVNFLGGCIGTLGFSKCVIIYARFWDSVRTQEQIIDHLNLAVDSGDVDWTHLVAQYRFGQTDRLNNTIDNDTSIITPQLDFSGQDASYYDGTEYYDTIGSHVLAEYPLTADNQFTLRFPLTKPSGIVNFCPVVYWIDAITGLSYRRKLWWDVGEVIWGVDNYNGELLPSSCTLEIWSIPRITPAAQTITQKLLTSLLFLQTSASAKDQYDILIDTPTEDSTLCATYPLTIGAGVTFNNALTFESL